MWLVGIFFLEFSSARINCMFIVMHDLYRFMRFFTYTILFEIYILGHVCSRDHTLAFRNIYRVDTATRVIYLKIPQLQLQKFKSVIGKVILLDWNASLYLFRSPRLFSECIDLITSTDVLLALYINLYESVS